MAKNDIVYFLERLHSEVCGLSGNELSYGLPEIDTDKGYAYINIFRNIGNFELLEWRAAMVAGKQPSEYYYCLQHASIPALPSPRTATYVEYISEHDYSALKKLFQFLHEHPALAWYRHKGGDLRDYNIEYVDEEEAKKEYARFLLFRSLFNKFQEDILMLLGSILENNDEFEAEVIYEGSEGKYLLNARYSGDKTIEELSQETAEWIKKASLYMITSDEFTEWEFIFNSCGVVDYWAPYATRELPLIHNKQIIIQPSQSEEEEYFEE